MAHRMAINDCKNCNEKNICEVQNTMNNWGFRCKMFSPYRPQTNADRIRAMSDEELARWVTSGIKSVLARCKGYELSPAFEQEMFDWLREEVTDGEQS